MSESNTNVKSIKLMEIGKQIIETAIKNGATLAGIANVKALKTSASHLIYTQLGNYSGVGTIKDDDTLTADQLFNWPETARSILVIGLSHPRGLQKLDWWDGKAGTPGMPIPMKSPVDSGPFRHCVPRHCATLVGAQRRW